MKNFMLLFRGGLPPKDSPELIQKHMMKWPVWIESIAKQGKFVGGEQLTFDGSVVKGAKKQIIDGPFAEAKEVVGGYIIISAIDKAEAVQLSLGCPIYEYDGICEIREIRSRPA
jgi:hypothetical protein